MLKCLVLPRITLTKTIPGINIVVGFPYNIYDMFEGYKSSLVILDDLRQNIRMTNVYQIYLHAVHIIKISVLIPITYKVSIPIT